MEQTIYVASQDPQGGIYRYSLSRQGKLTLQQKYPVDRPAYLCAEGNRLYALLREPFAMQSGIAAFEIQPDGSLVSLGPGQPTHGTVASHVLAWEGALLAPLFCTPFLGTAFT